MYSGSDSVLATPAPTPPPSAPTAPALALVTASRTDVPTPDRGLLRWQQGCGYRRCRCVDRRHRRRRSESTSRTEEEEEEDLFVFDVYCKGASFESDEPALWVHFLSLCSMHAITAFSAAETRPSCGHSFVSTTDFHRRRSDDRLPRGGPGQEYPHTRSRVVTCFTLISASDQRVNGVGSSCPGPPRGNRSAPATFRG